MRQTVKNKIVSRIYGRGRGWVFFPKDFIEEFGRGEIGVALASLVKEGKIRRIAAGLYDYPAYSEILKQKVPPEMQKVAEALARKHKWRVYPDGETALNILGLSPQVVARHIYLSDGPNRRYKIGNRDLIFKRTITKEVALKYFDAALVIQAVKAYGEKQINDDFIRALSDRFSPDVWRKIKADSVATADWIYRIISKIAEELKDKANG